MSQLLTINLAKGPGASWGFRLQGGKDFAQPLCIQKVNFGSVAEGAGLQAGDAIVSIAGNDALSLRHKEAQDAIVRAGNSFQMVVQRGSLTWKPQVTALSQPKKTPEGPVMTQTSLAAPSKQPAKYNTPINLYNEDALAETLSAQSEVLGKGCLGINFRKFDREVKLRTDSPTYQLIHGDESGAGKAPFRPPKQLPPKEEQTEAPKPVFPAPQPGQPGYYNINDKMYCDVHAKQAAKHNPPAPNMVPVTVRPGAAPPAGAVPASSIKPPGSGFPSTYQPEVVAATPSSEPAVSSPAPPAAAAPEPSVASPIAAEEYLPAPVQEAPLQSEEVSGAGVTSAPEATSQQEETSGAQPETESSVPEVPSAETEEQQAQAEEPTQEVKSEQTVEAVPEPPATESEPAAAVESEPAAVESEPAAAESEPPAAVEESVVKEEAAPEVQAEPVVEDTPADTKAEEPVKEPEPVLVAEPEPEFYDPVEVKESPAAAPVVEPKSVSSSEPAQSFAAPQPSSVSAPGGSSANPQAFGAPSGGIDVRSHIPKKGPAPAPAPAPVPAPSFIAPKPVSAPAPVPAPSFIAPKPASAPAPVPAPSFIAPKPVSAPAPAPMFGGASSMPKPIPPPGMGKPPGMGGAPTKGYSGERTAPRRGRGIMTPAHASRIPICASCQIQIRGPFVTALGKNWCPDHFHCATDSCRKPLIDVGFVEEQGQLYCEDCYEKYLAPTCGKCDKRIKGDCLNAVGKQFHPECFCCAYCGKVFGSGAFYLEDGLPYCETDWNDLFTTKCVGCGFPIEAGDRWVEALNNNYHSQCFKCSKCHKNLEGQSFFAKGGKPFCKSHAQRGF